MSKPPELSTFLFFAILASLFISNIKADTIASHAKASLFKIPETELQKLRTSFEHDGGLVITPLSENYELYSTPWSKKCRDRPQLILVPGSYENARLTFVTITEYDQSYTIMNGGHDFECGSTTQHTLINMGLLNAVKHDFQKQQIVAQAGAKWKDLYEAIKDSGFQVIGGQSLTVGVTGFVTGAGFNWKLSQFYGCGGENVLQALVILANGDMVHATRDNEFKDLMWGLFGAGGRNFGFIVELTIKLHPYREKKYNFFGASYQISNFEQLRAATLNWLKIFKEQRPAQGYGGSSVIIYPQVDPAQGYLMTVDSVCKECSFAKDYEDVLTTFPPSSVIFEDQKMSFYDYEMKYVVQDNGPYPETVDSNGMSAFTQELNIIDFSNILELLHKANILGGSLQITHFLGSVFNPSLTSFPFDSAVWKIADGFVWTDPSQEPTTRAKMWNKLVQEGSSHKYVGSYINYIDYSLDNHLTNYFGSNLDELVKLKQKYDPMNKFNRKWGVPLH